MFIGGYGRSGSTIIDVLLNRVPGIVAVGEFRHLFGRALGDNELCSCSLKFRDCPFWREVIAEAFPTGIDHARVQAAVRHFNRLTMLPKLRHERLMNASDREAAQLYQDTFSAAYKAVAKISGASVVVDSTKYPMHGWFLTTMPNIDLNVMLLVRDPRAVTYSWQRTRLRPEIWWEHREMPRHNALRSALAWNVSNGLTTALESVASDYREQRYEDFVADPRGELEDIASFALGTRTSVPEDLFDKPLHAPHTIAGNPVRISSEHVTVKADTKWLDMSLRDRLVVDSVCLPGMLHHDYPLHINRSNAALAP